MNFKNKEELEKYCEKANCDYCTIRRGCEGAGVACGTQEHFNHLQKYFRKQKLEKLLS